MHDIGGAINQASINMAAPDLARLGYEADVARIDAINQDITFENIARLQAGGRFVTRTLDDVRFDNLLSNADEYRAFGAADVKIHGNSKLSPKTAYLYKLETGEGEFLKYGLTQDLDTRYSKAYMADKEIIQIDAGSRSDMLILERQLVTANPGPLNMEPWAKAARAAGRGQ